MNKYELKLRDKFAGKAMMGILSNIHFTDAVGNEVEMTKKSSFIFIAQASYEYADAMLNERNKR